MELELRNRKWPEPCLWLECLSFPFEIDKYGSACFEAVSCFCSSVQTTEVGVGRGWGGSHLFCSPSSPDISGPANAAFCTTSNRRKTNNPDICTLFLINCIDGIPGFSRQIPQHAAGATLDHFGVAVWRSNVATVTGRSLIQIPLLLKHVLLAGATLIAAVHTGGQIICKQRKLR